MGYENCDPVFITHMLGYGVDTDKFIDAVEENEEFTKEDAVKLLEAMCEYTGWADNMLKEFKEYIEGE